MTTQTEEWKTAMATPNRVIEVSDQGMIRIRDRETGELIRDRFPGYYNKYTGYFGSYAGNQVHRLVALAFVPNPEGFEQVGHKNDDRTDNRADNLMWITRRMNNNTRHANRLRRESLRLAPKHSGMRVRGVKDG